MKIVIADDSSLLRDRIVNLLNSIDNVSEVDEAENGVEALQLIREKDPDVAILYIRMPEMNGIEVLKRIRELRMKTKVCILTNYPYPQYKKRCFEAGADYFLKKTEDFEDINIVIAEISQFPIVGICASASGPVNDKGDINGPVMTFTDITIAKKPEIELKEANEALRRTKENL